MGPLAVSQLAVWGFSIGLGPSLRLGQFSALGASLGARISASKDGGRRLLRLEARLGGALTIPGLRQQQLWNVCSPSLLSVRALRRRGVSSQMARQGQSTVQSKDGGGAALGFSRGWFSLRSGHVCAHLVRRPCGGWYRGWEARRPRGGSKERAGAGRMSRVSPAVPLLPSCSLIPQMLLRHLNGKWVRSWRGRRCPSCRQGDAGRPPGAQGSDSHLCFLGS